MAAGVARKAAGSRVPSLYSRGGMLFSSVDGQTWTQRLVVPPDVEWHDFTGITYGNGTFIAVGPTGRIYQTPDVRAQLNLFPAFNGFAVRLLGYAQGLYVTDVSTNLSSWEPRWTNRIDSAGNAATVSPAQPGTFYRARFLRD